ncbi:hypothetical protein Nepgr_006823 [Nepenthes gracilis]|uniref:Uncharacterized protein n=1 Tax=Nepenthes gracilis TaxID=150966 RepID=A0AAD3S5R4_NEPGR|nr:hypothetical protein Nepgr_006823 [Nepenthes gracilis]
MDPKTVIPKIAVLALARAFIIPIKKYAHDSSMLMRHGNDIIMIRERKGSMCQSLCLKMLQYEPSKQITAKKAMELPCFNNCCCEPQPSATAACLESLKPADRGLLLYLRY